MRNVVPSEFDRMRIGARSGPSISTWIGQPSASMTGINPPIANSRPFHSARLERADRPLDEGLRHALVAHQLEDPRQFAGTHMRGHARIFGEHGTEIALF